MFAEVIIDTASDDIDRSFTYAVHNFSSACIGSRVLVNFANRNTEAFVIALKEACSLDISKVKPILKVLDENPVILPEQIALMHDMAAKFFLRKIDCIRLFMPPSLRKRKRSIKLEKSEVRTPYKALQLENKFITFTQEQKAALSQIETLQNQTVLLHGVTGSGKTEIYLKLIEDALKQNKTAIMLVPEISLTPQIFSRFKGKFGNLVAIIHSGLSDGERLDEFSRILSGQAKVVVGARSAVFMPVQNVGVIIMDEEHDGSYQSESNPRYFTHGVATFRSRYNGCNLILGSATPCIETYFEAKAGRIQLIELNRRALKVELPEILIADMGQEMRMGNTGIFSGQLLQKLHEAVDNGQQAMVFINRRGFSSFLRCGACGHIPKCTDCDVSLAYHKEDDVMQCHFCGKKFKTFTHCPGCDTAGMRNGGVGTERVVDELKKLFPGVLVLRMDNDTTKTKDAHIEILQKFKETTPAILVGTQMIAKGHDFPHVQLVGIVDADLSLHFSDYRAVERTFQLISQVSGRAGRHFGNGVVVLQTYTPKHYAYRFAMAHNYKDFYDKEINLRKTTQFPPYTTVARVLAAGNNEGIVRSHIKKLFDALNILGKKHEKEFIVLMATKAPVKKIQNKFRYIVLMRFQNTKKHDILKEIDEIIMQHKQKGVAVFLEVNPQNLN